MISVGTKTNVSTNLYPHTPLSMSPPTPPTHTHTETSYTPLPAKTFATPRRALHIHYTYRTLPFSPLNNLRFLFLFEIEKTKQTEQRETSALLTLFSRFRSFFFLLRLHRTRKCRYKPRKSFLGTFVTSKSQRLFHVNKNSPHPLAQILLPFHQK